MSSKKRVADAMDDRKDAWVPRLRFPEFRGKAGWEEKRLGNEGELLSSLSGKAGSDFDAGEARFVTYMNVFSNTFVDPNALRFVDVKKGESQNPVSIGDVFFTISSETPEEVGMSSVLLDELDDCYLNSFCALFRFFPQNRPDSIFTGYLLRQPLVRNYFTKKAQGSTRFNLSKDAFRNLPLIVPSLAEQQKIAECLSSLDDVIAAQARKVDALKTHKKGLMQQLFPRDGTTRPLLRFPEFRGTAAWELMPLSKLIASLDAGVSVNSGDRPAASGEVGVLKTSAVTNGVFEPNENKLVSDATEIGRVKEHVKADTIIISRMNTPALVGANAYVSADLKNIFLPDRLWAAKASRGTSMLFVSFVLGTAKGRAALSKLAKGSSGSMKNITKPEVLALSILAPTSSEQRRIASCLSNLDALIAAETRKLETLKRHKRGLMQQLFPSGRE